MRRLRPALSADVQPETTDISSAVPPRVIAVQPLSGGAGASLLTANLALELARSNPGLRICILDLDLQFGTIATYLDLPPEPRITDAYHSLATMDSDAFQLCLQPAGSRIRVFAAPAEILPIDSLTAGDLQRLVGLAREQADLVLIDLPHVISDWTAAAYAAADLLLALGLLDVRTARNSARLRDLLQTEGIAAGRLNHLLNRLPQRKSRAQAAQLAEFTRGIGGPMLAPIPEGGALITVACNLGQPLWREAAHNPARLAIRNLARQILAGAAEKPMADAQGAG